MLPINIANLIEMTWNITDYFPAPHSILNHRNVLCLASTHVSQHDMKRSSFTLLIFGARSEITIM